MCFAFTHSRHLPFKVLQIVLLARVLVGRTFFNGLEPAHLQEPTWSQLQHRTHEEGIAVAAMLFKVARRYALILHVCDIW